MSDDNVLKGGEFLIKETLAQDVFIPEEFDEEQIMIAETCNDFLETEIFPNLDQIDKNEPGYMRGLLEKAGELGLLGISIPEEYDGFGQSFVTSMLASDKLGAGHSFVVAFSAHTGIGSLPILYYGTEEQKQKYITKLATGEWMGAYCLTEPNAGSDANSGKTKATLSEDGKHYILNGQKMWITNGGFADVQTVFAKIDNDRVLSAFIVEKDYEGVVLNPEEKKMGIKGSSTVQIFYNDVKVPVENLLGKRGEGFRIALNILHIGRIKLGGNVIGGIKKAIDHSVNYANERKQFGQCISNFGAIKHKLAEQVIRTFALEAAVYRTSKYIDDKIEHGVNQGLEKGKAIIQALEEYGIEAAILKVYGAESLDYVVDETVQIFGGMGFSSESEADRCYRDSRINRIFEGTNEINRLVVIDTAVKKSLKGNINICLKAAGLRAELPNTNVDGLSYYEEKYKYLENFKSAISLVLGTAHEQLKREFGKEQEMMMNISDMMIQTFIAASLTLRVEKMELLKCKEDISLYRDMVDVFIYDTASRIAKFGQDAVNAFAEGETQTSLLNSIDVLSKVKPVNIKEARRRIADYMIEENKYKF